MDCRIAAAIVACVGLVALGSARADVYKCLDHGQTSYQDRPCPAGARTALHQGAPVDPPATAEEKAQAKDRAAAEAELRKLAAQLYLVTRQAHALDEQYRSQLEQTHRTLDKLPADEQRRRKAAFDAQWRDRLQILAQQRGSLMQQIRQVCPHGAQLERTPPVCMP